MRFAVKTGLNRVSFVKTRIGAEMEEELEARGVPAEVIGMIRELDPSARQEALQNVLQATEIELRPLCEKDLVSIKVGMTAKLYLRCSAGAVIALKRQQLKHCLVLVVALQRRPQDLDRTCAARRNAAGSLALCPRM